MSVIIRLQNLPLTAGAADVRAFFTGLKIPDGAVHIIGGDEGDAFIGFASDEDARQAMRRDRQNIHQTEVRLYLSSRTEMASVIEQVKNGGPPKVASPEPQQPAAQSQPPTQYRPKPDRTWSNEPAYPVFNASSTNFSDQNQPLYSRDDYQKAEPEFNSQSEPVYGGFKQSSFPGRSDPPAARWPTSRFAPQEDRKPTATSSSRSIDDLLASLPPHLRPPHGVPPPHLQHLFAKGEVEKDHDSRSEKTSGKEESWRASVPFENDPDQRKQQPFARGNSRFNGAPAFQPFNDNAMKAILQEAQKVQPFPAASSEPNGGPSPFLPGAFPFSAQGTSLPLVKYVELTRVPEKLQRPAPLEEFIRPIKSLSLSAVKMVYTPRGVHICTIIRFENLIDAENLLKRDGEMGIRIRPATKEDFDKAEDGIPDERDRRGSSPRRGSRDRPRDNRDRERGDRQRRRSPLRRRRRLSRSRSPLRQPANSTRWCLQLTNVPFKCKEEDVARWMADKVKPARLTRTYYEDGNASDRWVAEFNSEAEMEKAMDLKEQLDNRNIKMKFISNDRADEIIAIEDKYGEVKKKMNEEQAAKLNPNGVPTAPVQPLTGLFGGANNFQKRFPSNGHPIPPMHVMRGGMPMRGAARGRGGFPMGPPRQQFGGGMDRGGYRGGRAGAPAGRPNGFSSRENGTTEDEFTTMINSLGKPGTVLICSGFPNTLTLDDVMTFFDGFHPDNQSVRMKTDEKNVLTGECILAVEDPDFARKAVTQLDGKTFQGAHITVKLAADVRK